jgi:hypothetical protein
MKIIAVVFKFLFCLHVVNSQKIEDLLNNLDILNNPLVLNSVKLIIKKEMSNNIEKAIEKLKNETTVYTGKNKVNIDKIEEDLKKYLESDNILQEEKYLKSILDNFRELINSSEAIKEKRRMQDFINLAEKVIKYMMDNIEKLGSSNLDDIFKYNNKDNNENSNNSSNSKYSGGPPNENNKDQQNSSTTPNSEHFPLPIPMMIIICVCIIIIATFMVYFLYMKKNRLRKNDVEYVPHVNDNMSQS